MERLGDGAGRGGPDVHDAGGQRQLLGLAKDGVHPVEFGGRRPTGPDGAVPEGLDLTKLVGWYLLPLRVVAEDAESAELWFRHGWVNPPRRPAYSVAICPSRTIGYSAPSAGASSGLGATSGSTMMKRVSPGLDSTRMLPWCFWATIRQARSSPRPVPSPKAFVVKKGVKIR